MGVPLDFDEAKELDAREPLTELRNEFEINVVGCILGQNVSLRRPNVSTS